MFLITLKIWNGDKRLYFLLLVALLAGACGFLDDASGYHANRAAEPLATGWYQLVDSREGVARKLGTDSIYYLDPSPIVTSGNFKTMAVEPMPHDSALWQVVVQLDETGRKLFAKATEALIGEDLAFVLGDSLWSEPIRIQGKIPSGVIVLNKRGDFPGKRLRN